MFKGDAFERVQIFKYLGILLDTTLDMDNVMEHLAVASKCLLFALNYCCAELGIMDVKLHCDFFNMLVCSIASYACEVWVDSKKKTIKVVYRRFFKSMLEAQKITNTSIVLVEFGKFPFEQFTWGQTMLYYNCVRTVSKDCILGKAWGA